jgi:hypothetical protein
MPDISLCTQKECPKSSECYRFRAIPNEYWQSYFAPKFGENGCEYFIAIELGDRVKEPGE